MIYNNSNIFGGGCLDPDVPLTRLGKKYVEAVHEHRIVLDVCEVRVGSFCLFGPAVQVYTPMHPTEFLLRPPILRCQLAQPELVEE